MAKQVQFRRGTTAQHSTFTGLAGELTVDTTLNSIVVHDGSTAGGHTIATVNGLTQSNVGMKGYVDDQITSFGSHYSNVDVLAYLTTNSYATETYATTAVTTANVAMKGYVDNEVTEITNGTNTFGNILPSANLTYNLGSPTAKWNELHLGSSTLYIGGESLSTADITNWNTAYGWGDHSTQSYATTTDVTTANVGIKGYVDNEVSTVNSAITQANVGLKGYADATFLTSFTETNDLSASVTWANIPDANVPQSAVTQHQAALSITESQISDLQSYLTSYTETNDLTSAVTWTNIPDANVPSSAVTQHQANLSITESQISDLGSYVESDTTGITGADQVTNMVSLSQAEYDAITPNASTVYIIVG